MLITYIKYRSCEKSIWKLCSIKCTEGVPGLAANRSDQSNRLASTGSHWPQDQRQVGTNIAW